MYKFELVNDTTNLTKKDIVRAKGMVGTLPTLKEMSGEEMTILSVITFHVTPDQESKEEYNVSIYQAVNDASEDVSFQSSSEFFLESVVDIMTELDEGSGVKIKIVERESKNNKGYHFYRAIVV